MPDKIMAAFLDLVRLVGGPRVKLERQGATTRVRLGDKLAHMVLSRDVSVWLTGFVAGLMWKKEAGNG